MIAETCAKHDIQPGHLTIHADRGGLLIWAAYDGREWENQLTYLPL